MWKFLILKKLTLETSWGSNFRNIVKIDLSISWWVQLLPYFILNFSNRNLCLSIYVFKFSAIEAVKSLQVQFDEMYFDEYDSLETYHEIRMQLEEQSTKFQTFITKTQYILPFLQPGRMIKVFFCFSYYSNFFDLVLLVALLKCLKIIQNVLCRKKTFQIDFLISKISRKKN